MKTNAYRLVLGTLALPLAVGVWSCASGTSTPNSDQASSAVSPETAVGPSSAGTVASTSASKPDSTKEASSTGQTSADDDSTPGQTLPDPTTQATSADVDSDPDTTQEQGSSPSDEAGGTDSRSDSTSADSTSDDVVRTRFVFTVSVGGVVRALRLDPGAEPVQVADFQLDVTFGDFFIAATSDGSRIFVSYNQTAMALAFDHQTPEFTQLDTAATAGGGTYIEVSPDGEHVIVAHYNEGKVTHLPFDGTAFGSSSESSPGSNAHSARVHGSGDWAYVPCLGSNHVAQFTLGATLSANTPPSVSVPGGPRHMTFHPNGEVAYVLTELSGQAYAFAINSDGTLGPDPLDVEVVAAGVEQPSGSDVQITPDGKHLYTFIRRTQDLYHFDIGQDGTLTASGEPTNFGQEVRAFTISPTGDVLLGGGSAGILHTYAIDAESGELIAIGDGLPNLDSIQATVIRDVPVSL